jgi:hypothetical protein
MMFDIKSIDKKTELNFIFKAISSSILKDEKQFSEFASKQFFKNEILSKSPIVIDNPSILSTNMSVYGYYDCLGYFKEVLEDTEFVDENVLVSPFVDPEILMYLEAKGLNLIIYELDFQTLCPKIEQFKNLLIQYSPIFVIHNTLNQFLTPLIEINKELEKTRLIILDSSISFNSQFYEILNKFENLTYLKVIQKNLISKLIYQLSDVNLTSQQFFISIELNGFKLNILKKSILDNEKKNIKFLESLNKAIEGRDKKDFFTNIKSNLIKNIISLDNAISLDDAIENIERSHSNFKYSRMADYWFLFFNNYVINNIDQFSIKTKKNFELSLFKINKIFENDSKVYIPRCNNSNNSIVYIYSEDINTTYSLLKNQGIMSFKIPDNQYFYKDSFQNDNVNIIENLLIIPIN